ncbi:MAG: T9SS type A sorting domain-containing protein [bacterium]
MKKLLPTHLALAMFVLLMPALTLAQFPEVTIQEIQSVPPESLAIAVDASPFEGDTVTTVGVVTAPPGLSSSVEQGDATMYIMDPSGGVEFSGINVFTQGGTGNLLAGLQLGDSIRVTGRVQEFSTITELVPTKAPDILGFGIPPEPVLIDPADLGGTTQDTVDFATAERWEGVLVKIENVTIVNDMLNQFSAWVVEDDQGSQAVVGAKVSDSLRVSTDARGTGNVDPSAAFVVPPVGTRINSIIGIVDSRFGENSVSPRFPSSDIILGAGVPALIGNAIRNPILPKSTESAEITVKITDTDGTVTSAMLSYEVNGGGLVEMPMNAAGGDTFTAVIPAQADGSLVTYFIKATDNETNESFAPSGAPNNNRFFYHVRDQGLLIEDIQKNPFGDNSGYVGLTVTINGITVSDSTDFFGRFYVQQGSGAWNGIQVFTNAPVEVARGDSVSVTGRVNEFFDLTEIELEALAVISSGNPVPEPFDVNTGDIRTGSPTAESFESVLVRVSNLEITNANPDAPSDFGEFVVDDGTGGVRVDDRGHTFSTTDTTSANFLPLGTTIESLTGVLDFSFNNFKLQPRNNNDFQGIVTDVEELDSNVPESFTLFQNYPNPFNPETTIRYRLPSAQPVQLKIFNILGQQIRSLIDKQQLAGDHKIVWDGKDDRGILMPSGVYIYRIQAGDFEKSNKMILLK